MAEGLSPLVGLSTHAHLHAGDVQTGFNALILKLECKKNYNILSSICSNY